MNLLAHSHLGLHLDPLANSVNTFWDLIGDDLLTDQRPNIRAGANMHWHIDRSMDSSAFMRDSVALFSKKRRRVASVLMDLFCDYLLASHWQTFNSTGVDDHIDMIVGSFKEHAEEIGPPAPRVHERFDALNWFYKYKTIDGLADVLIGMSKRSSPRIGKLLAGGEEELVRIEDDLREGFVEFYKEMITLTKDYE